MTDRGNYISIGKIVKSVGLKGIVKTEILTDFPERFIKLTYIYLYDERNQKFFLNEKNDKDFGVKVCGIKKGYVNLQIEGFDSKEKADSILNHIIQIKEEDRIELPEGEFYYYELIDSEVYNRGDFIGKVTGTVNYGSGELLCVLSGINEILIPIMNKFVKKIDIKNRRIETDLIEGFY